MCCTFPVGIVGPAKGSNLDVTFNGPAPGHSWHTFHPPPRIPTIIRGQIHDKERWIRPCGSITVSNTLKWWILMSW